MAALRFAGTLAALLTLCLASSPARADFDAVFLYEVFKDLSLTDSTTEAEYQRLQGVERLSVTLKPTGNLLRKPTLAQLQIWLEDTRKTVWQRPPLRDKHIERLRELRALRVRMDCRKGPLSAEDRRQLERLDRARREFLFSAQFGEAELKSLAGLRNYEILIEAPEGLSAAAVARLAKAGKVRKGVIVGPDVTPAALRALMPLEPLRLVLRSRVNALGSKVVATVNEMLDKRKKMQVEIIVDRTLNQPQVNALSRVRAFDLRVDTTWEGQRAPVSNALVKLLNSMKPPGR